MCLDGVDIFFYRSVNMFLYCVFTKLGALNAYNDFDLKLNCKSSPVKQTRRVFDDN